MNRIRLGEVRYNPQMGAFEARVDVEREGVLYRYPCQVAGPVDMDKSYVRARLEKHAMMQSDTGGFLRSAIQ